MAGIAESVLLSEAALGADGLVQITFHTAVGEQTALPVRVVALVLDGKRFAEDTMVIALGITLGGEKVLLGFVQTGTENATTCAAFLRGLLDRGLRIADGLLVVLDGGKGLRRAVREVFGAQAQIQRCTWHKRENVVAYLPKHLQAAWRAKLQHAYRQPTYAAARAMLDRRR